MEQLCFRESSGLICHICKSLYDLKHTNKVWFEKFSNVVQQFGITYIERDHLVFYRHSKTYKVMFVLIYII